MDETDSNQRAKSAKERAKRMRRYVVAATLALSAVAATRLPLGLVGGIAAVIIADLFLQIYWSEAASLGRLARSRAMWLIRLANLVLLVSALGLIGLFYDRR